MLDGAQQRSRIAVRTALLVIGRRLVVRSAQLCPFREFVLRAGSVQFELEPDNLFLQDLGLLRIFRGRAWELAVQHPQL